MKNFVNHYKKCFKDKKQFIYLSFFYKDKINKNERLFSMNSYNLLSSLGRLTKKYTEKIFCINFFIYHPLMLVIRKDFNQYILLLD